MKSWHKEIWLILLIVILVIMVQLWGSQKALDIRLYYSAIESKDFFASLSPDEVKAYIRHEIFDLVFIFVYTYLLFLQIRRVYKPSLPMTLIAIAPGAFDLAETTTILTVLHGAFEAPAWLGAMTFIKWVTSVVVILLILMGWVRKTLAPKI